MVHFPHAMVSVSLAAFPTKKPIVLGACTADKAYIGAKSSYLKNKKYFVSDFLICSEYSKFIPFLYVMSLFPI